MRRLLIVAAILLAGMPAAQATTIDVRVLVLMVNFSNDTTQPYTTTTASGVMGQVAQFWSDSSTGQLQITSDVHGWYTIADDNTGCDTNTWVNQARAAAIADGVALGQYTHTVYGFSSAQCPWRGAAGGSLAGGTVYLAAGFQLERVNHEFGHALGLNFHTGATDYPGAPRAEGSNYSFFFGAMWTANAGERDYIGIIAPTVVTTSGSYPFSPLHQGGALRIPRPDGTRLVIDWRQDTLWADEPLDGITIWHIAPQYPQVALVKTGPCSGYVLGYGQSWYDAGARVLITAHAGSVDVVFNADPPSQLPDTTPPSVPSGLQAKKGKTIALWWNASTDDQDCSPLYRVYRNGGLVATVDSPSFTDTAFPRRTTLTYSVRAIDDAGNVSGPTSVQVQT